MGFRYWLRGPGQGVSPWELFFSAFGFLAIGSCAIKKFKATENHYRAQV